MIVTSLYKNEMRLRKLRLLRYRIQLNVSFFNAINGNAINGNAIKRNAITRNCIKVKTKSYNVKTKLLVVDHATANTHHTPRLYRATIPDPRSRIRIPDVTRSAYGCPLGLRLSARAHVRTRRAARSADVTRSATRICRTLTTAPYPHCTRHTVATAVRSHMALTWRRASMDHAWRLAAGGPRRSHTCVHTPVRKLPAAVRSHDPPACASNAPLSLVTRHPSFCSCDRTPSWRNPSAIGRERSRKKSEHVLCDIPDTSGARARTGPVGFTRSPRSHEQRKGAAHRHARWVITLQNHLHRSSHNGIAFGLDAPKSPSTWFAERAAP